jgi:colanic acid biosynthesis glycosyl transferase WcaI
MRILVHTIFYAPDLTGVAKYTAELCDWLTARGHQVRVVAPPPYYPQWTIKAPYKGWRYVLESAGGVPVRRCPIWMPRRPGGLSRIAYAASFAIASLPVMLYEALRGADLVIAIEPSLLNSPAALMAARIAGAMAWLHIQDFELDLAYDLGQIRRGRRVAEKIETWIMRRFDVVSSISQRLLEKVRSKGVPADSLCHLPNTVNLEEIRPLPHPSPLRERLGIPADRIVALFSGSLGAKQGVETIVDAARILQSDRRILIVICGEGLAASRLRAQASGLVNLLFLPLQPAQELNDLMNLADLHLLPQHAAAAGSVLPSKLIGMLASGRPIIAACQPGSEIDDLVSGCGIITAPGDPQAVASAILDLASDPGARMRMAEAARKRAVQKFGQDSSLHRFERDMLDRMHIAGRGSRVGLAPE